MPYIPEQLRAIDPWSENRFSNNLNLRSRMITGGRDIIVFEESFNLEIVNNTTLKVTAGVLVKDDVMVHVMQDTDMDLQNEDDWIISTQSQPGIPVSAQAEDYDIHVFVEYKYARSIPPAEAKYICIKHGNSNQLLDHYNSERHLWLGMVTVLTDGGTNRLGSYSMNPVRITDPPREVTFKRTTMNPLGSIDTINCGVVRYDIPPDVDWFENWEID
jgi:hypothetical protein